MIITKDLLLAAKSEKGGYTKKQLAAIGIAWPPSSGWKNRVLGKDISDEQAKAFLGDHPSPVEVDINRERDEVNIYIYEHCDNSIKKRGNYIVLMEARGKELRMSNSFMQTSSYRLIIQGAIDAIQKLKKPCRIHLYTSTAFGLSKIASSNRSLTYLDKSSVNADLLSKLENVLVSGSHSVNLIVNKECVYDKIFSAEKKFISVGLSVDLYNQLMDKCCKKNVHLSTLINKLLSTWIEEDV